jgi:hypothetical protein
MDEERSRSAQNNSKGYTPPFESSDDESKTYLQKERIFFRSTCKCHEKNAQASEKWKRKG